jgi:cbb3-type cytochrome oxidase maturation protein
MSILILLVILAILIAGSFLAAFFWATHDGQFEDTFSPSVRILMENDRKENKKEGEKRF